MKKRLKATEIIKKAENPIDWKYENLGSSKENLKKMVIRRIGKERIKIYVIHGAYWV